MANISTFLDKILEAVYGEEVRSSIHDALAAMNVESSSAMQYASTAKDSAQASAVSARDSASAAERKAEEANISASEAKASELNARTSEDAAAGKAAEAAESAAAAKASETAAANSEAEAIQKALDASGSESSAAQSAAEAKAAEERIRTIKSEAEILAAQTAADQSAAETAKTAAEAARDAAALSQTNAKKSEDAVLAAQSAVNDAKSSAEEANQAAQDAKTAAEAARDSASDDAQDALQAAADAAGSALSAQQYSGKPSKPQNGTWWIWDAEQQTYLDSGIACDLVGPTGNGIQDIQLTKGDHTPGTTDIYTVTMTDGTSYSISVYNGRNGTGTGDVRGIYFDLVIPAEGWLNGEITVADSRFLASASHKYLLIADEGSREEYTECGVRAKDITATGFITFTNNSDPTEDLTVNVIRLEMTANGE